jgi:hypothetical protein
MSAVKRDENSVVGIVAQNVAGTNVVYPTGVTLTNSTPQHVSIVDVTGTQITAFASALNLSPFDYVARVLTNATTETYTFKSGGAAGTTTNTVVIVYTDATLSTLSTVTKT